MSKVFEALQKAERDQTGSVTQANAEEAKELPLEQPLDLPELESLAHFSAAPAGAKDVSAKVSPWLVVHWEPNSAAVEQIKRVRTHILHYAKGPSAPRSIMISSSISDEGKSFIAANLAVSIAQGLSESVILVDGDIRSPSLHHYFSQPQGPGLADYLEGQVELEAVIRATGIPKVSFIAGGGKKKNPVELISSERMTGLIEALREKGKDGFFVFDSTPVLLTNEPSIMAKMMDAIIFVVRQNLTPRHAVKEAISILTKEKITGLIFNDSQIEPFRLYGYSHYGYDYDHSSSQKGKKTKKKKS
jgi:protein-tyrosine kinase